MFRTLSVADESSLYLHNSPNTVMSVVLNGDSQYVKVLNEAPHGDANAEVNEGISVVRSSIEGDTRTPRTLFTE